MKIPIWDIFWISDNYLTLKATYLYHYLICELLIPIELFQKLISPNSFIFSGQIVKTCEFWILWSTFFLNTQAIGYINSMYKAYGQVFINDDHFLAVVGAFAAIFNASGRVFWGHLCDKFGYRSCMLVVTASMVGYAASNLKVYKKNLTFRVKEKFHWFHFGSFHTYLTTTIFSTIWKGKSVKVFWIY